MRNNFNEFESNDSISSLLNAALETMSDGFTIWDKNFNLIAFNQPYKDIYYNKIDGLKIGMSLKELCDLSIINGNYENISAKELFIKISTIFKKAPKIKEAQILERSIKDLKIRSTFIYAKDVGHIVTHKDISNEVRQAELNKEQKRQLTTQNIWFNTAINHMSHGLCLFGADKRLIICNKAYANLFELPQYLVKPGTKFEDILAYRVKNNLMADNETKDEFLSKRLSITKKESNIQAFVETIKGRKIDVIRKKMADGGWVSTQQDITKQCQEEEIIKARSIELLQQNMRFDAAVNNMLHGLAMFDKNHNLVICNDPYKRLYNIPDELSKPGTNFWDILAHGAKSGMVSIANPTERFETLNKIINDAKPFKGPIHMVNGQTLFVQHQPLEDGGWLSTHEDITEQHKSEELIRYLAHHDGLTGIANRSHFMQELENRVNKTKSNDIFGILSIDLDNFKPINDNFGHGAGDAVIKEIGKRISLHANTNAVVARLGGDEFAILIDKIKDKAEIEKFAQTISMSIQKPIEWDGIELKISASIGIAISANNNLDKETLMLNSDLALYYAKKKDGGSYCFFEKKMDEKRLKRQAIEAGLKKALKEGGLHLHFQPLVSLKNNKISCCEALMRWENEEQSFAPFEFIPVAEETGLIREMGKWAIQEACSTAAKWPNKERVAVNISPLQFINNDLVNQVADALIISGLDANRLELEITESLFLADSEQNLKILYDLKSLGVRIALDDFGTGYSSLSYLISFPFDKIKIDRSFISSLAKKKENISIIKAVVDIGQSMGMTTTAEGIETQEQLDAVCEQGCNEIQGYLFSPPLPKKAINEMLKVPTQALKLKTA